MKAALLREEEVSEYLRVARSTLRRWRAQGKGPAWTRIEGGRVRYPIERVHEWVESRTTQMAAGAR